MYGDSSSANLVLLLQSLGLPLLLMALGLVIFAVFKRRISSPLLTLLPALVLGFWASYCWIQGRLVFWPQQSMDVIPLMVLFGAAVELVGAPWRGQRSVVLVATLAFLLWLLYPIISRAAVLEAASIVAFGLLAYIGLEWGLRKAAEQRLANTQVLLLIAMAIPVIALDGSLKLAQLSGALATSVGVIWLMGLRFALPVLSTLGSMLVVALYLTAQQYAGVDVYALALLGMGALAVIPLRRYWAIESVWGEMLRVSALGLISLVLALWWVWPEQSLY